MLVVAVLLVTVLMRVAIVSAVVYLLLPPGPLCPQCRSAMLPIRNRFLDRLLPAIQRRWCLECGWNGVVRRGGAGAARTPPPPAPPPPAPRCPPRLFFCQGPGGVVEGRNPRPLVRHQHRF